MPLYTYFCNDCGMQHDAYRPVAERNRPPVCDCGGECSRGIEKPNLEPEGLYNYFDPNLTPMHSTKPGMHITSKKHRAETMKRLGLVEAG